ncbi:hypothetical protein LTR50_002808 [Elasticomyces elasticus]|nr:hypothetical protein LTR50_002808 [Elasticomyces elasticus]
MVLREDGTKWACHSCLRGHRHADRELREVPKKGRPVTQCQHCRSERKKRSAHVKCDCGEKPHPKEKCIHLREAEQRQNGFLVEGQNTTPEQGLSDPKDCCCGHTGKCTCTTVKREASGQPAESATRKPTPPVRPKPRIVTASSDGHITKSTNGCHRPVHRNNHTAHELGQPYKAPRSNTIHGRTLHETSCAARHSIDSQGLQNGRNPITLSLASLSSAFGQHDSSNSNLNLDCSVAPVTPLTGTVSGLDLQFPITSQSSIWFNDSTQTGADFTADPFEWSGNDQDFSMLSAVTDNPSDPWAFSSSNYNFSADQTVFNLPDQPLNPDLSYLAQPALTAASSGTQSDNDELPRIDDPFPANNVPPLIPDDSSSILTTLGSGEFSWPWQEYATSTSGSTIPDNRSSLRTPSSDLTGFFPGLNGATVVSDDASVFSFGSNQNAYRIGSIGSNYQAPVGRRPPWEPKPSNSGIASRICPSVFGSASTNTNAKPTFNGKPNAMSVAQDMTNSSPPALPTADDRFGFLSNNGQINMDNNIISDPTSFAFNNDSASTNNSNTNNNNNSNFPFFSDVGSNTWAPASSDPRLYQFDGTGFSVADSAASASFKPHWGS